MIYSSSTFVIAIISVVILFSLFLFVKLCLERRSTAFKSGTNPLLPYLAEKISGFLLFGIIPYIIFVKILSLAPGDVGLLMGNSPKYWHLLALTMVVITYLTYVASGMKLTRERYPQLRFKVWTLKNSVLSISGWLFYIIGYEFLFRGVLWSISYNHFGFLTALIINISLYALAHLDQGLEMTLGSVPVGFILCMFSLATGSFLFPFIIHLWMAMNNELFCIIRNPNIRFEIVSRRSPS